MRGSADRRIACLAVLLLDAENQINPNFLYFQATISDMERCRLGTMPIQARLAEVNLVHPPSSFLLRGEKTAKAKIIEQLEE